MNCLLLLGMGSVSETVSIYYLCESLWEWGPVDFFRSFVWDEISEAREVILLGISLFALGLNCAKTFATLSRSETCEKYVVLVIIE